MLVFTYLVIHKIVSYNARQNIHETCVTEGTIHTIIKYIFVLFNSFNHISGVSEIVLRVQSYYFGN